MSIPFIETVRLTPAELKVLGLSAELWNEYTKLDQVHPDEFEELRHFVHQVQCLLARRVAKRANPEVWS